MKFVSVLLIFGKKFWFFIMFYLLTWKLRNLAKNKKWQIFIFSSTSKLYFHTGIMALIIDTSNGQETSTEVPIGGGSVP